MNKNDGLGLKLAVLSMCCLNLTSMIISPTLPGVTREFPNVSITWIQNLTVMSSLTAIISAQASGFIMRYFSKRRLAIGSFILYLVTGLSILFVKHFTTMLFLRCLNGFALGLNSTLSTTLIAEFFSGEERKRVMGYRMPFQNMTAMFFSASSGILAECFGWRFSYLLFLTALFPLTMGVAHLPLVKPSCARANGNEEKAFGYKEFFRDCKGVVLLCLVHAMAVLATGINSTNIALLVSEKGFGDSGLGGGVTAIYLLFASLAGILFGRINRRLEKKLYPLACLLTALGLILTAVCRSVAVLIAAESLIGFWWSTFMARMNVTLACVSDGRTRDVIFSFFMATMNLGTFLNPYVSTTVTEIAGKSGASSRIMVGAVIMAFTCVITYLINGRGKEKIQGMTF